MQDWPLPEGVALRGVVVLVHGLGEHAGRYDHVARRLNGWGFAVRGYDQYGHGESDGVRGALPAQTRLVDDLADVIDSTRARMEAGTPLILLGHSLGGLVAASAVALGQVQVDALVLSSPAVRSRIEQLSEVPARNPAAHRAQPHRGQRGGPAISSRTTRRWSRPTRPTLACMTASPAGWRASLPMVALGSSSTRRGGRCPPC